ncbi:hypothetical protein R6242_21910 [Iodobacter sp. CM08]|uniref:hypothetical protein n=1 Tax=Iodobacter sp. CM08 TaxID=3085902 RepID=UPI002980B144|nr:hypothetical protein [Iodobacter sp. CM08]MDW5419233.1 hypothetical protein [Iodobacter sp. CM08]
MMKKTLIYATVLYASCNVYAEPAVGVFANLPVYNFQAGITKPVAFEMFVFTKKKLNSATIFSTFQMQEKGVFNVACCFDLVDLNPVSVEKILNKYSFDDTLVDSVKGIKGYQYVYNVSYSKQANNKLQKLLMKSHGLDTDIPYLMPAIEIKLLSDESIKGLVSTTPYKIELVKKHVKGSVQKDFYNFNVDGNRTTFSVPLQTGG